MSPLLETILIGAIFIIRFICESWNTKDQLTRLEKRIERLEKKK